MHCCIVETKYPAQPCLKTRNRLTKHCQTCLIHSIPLVQFQTNLCANMNFLCIITGFLETQFWFSKNVVNRLSGISLPANFTQVISLLLDQAHSVVPSESCPHHSKLNILPMSFGFCLKKSIHISDVVPLWRNFFRIFSLGWYWLCHQTSMFYNYSQQLVLWYLIAVKIF